MKSLNATESQQTLMKPCIKLKKDHYQRKEFVKSKFHENSDKSFKKNKIFE